MVKIKTMVSVNVWPIAFPSVRVLESHSGRAIFCLANYGMTTIRLGASSVATFGRVDEAVWARKARKSRLLNKPKECMERVSLDRPLFWLCSRRSGGGGGGSGCVIN
jgi:hypothetical protein